jgi:hypothetical protein
MNIMGKIWDSKEDPDIKVICGTRGFHSMRGF